MERIGQYLMTVAAAALICGVINGLLKKESTYAAIVKLICGLFLTVSILSPLTDFEIGDINLYADEFFAEAEAASAMGKNAAQSSMAKIIKQETEAYILDKATCLGMKVQVNVVLSADQLPIPEGVRITGSVSPYGKKVLSRYIIDELNIPEENQLWK